MLIPSLFSRLLFRLIRLLIELDVRLLAFSIQVLTHQVQDGIDALMRVMLAEPSKGGRILPQDPLEHLRGHSMLIHVPHLINQFSVGHDQSAFGPERVFLGKLVDELEA